MTARAAAVQNFAANTVEIHLGMDFDDRRTIAEPVELVWNANPEPAVYHPPALRLPEDVARALLDALAAYFGGTSEVQTLRKDYLAERARVDRLIEMVAEPRGLRMAP